MRTRRPTWMRLAQTDCMLIIGQRLLPIFLSDSSMRLFRHSNIHSLWLRVLIKIVRIERLECVKLIGVFVSWKLSMTISISFWYLGLKLSIVTYVWQTEISLKRIVKLNSYNDYKLFEGDVQGGAPLYIAFQ